MSARQPARRRTPLVRELARRLALGPSATTEERAALEELLRAADRAEPALVRGMLRALATAPSWLVPPPRRGKR